MRGSTVAKSSAAKATHVPEPKTAVAAVPPLAASAVPALDELIHERIRLALVSALAVNDSLTFKELKTLLKTTDGNLSVHARKLENAGYVECRKSFEKRIPKTEFRLTPTGRAVFEKYLNHMEALIAAMKRR